MTAGPALVAIGASLPGPGGIPPIETCRWAAAALDAVPGFRLRALSRWWESAPVPAMPGAPVFINGVALLEGEGEPEALLAALHRIEDQAGRARPFPNAPRTLDLDLIALGTLVRAGTAPILPHPRAHERAFVLLPLADVAPGWRHPGTGRNVAEMIAGLGRQAIRVTG